MIKGRLIVCIASSWEYDPTSKHHIMRILSRENDILWINYHASRRPGLSRIDFMDSLGTLRRVTRGLVRVHPTFSHLTPLVFPGATRPLIRRIHKRIVTAQVRRAIRLVRRSPNQPVQLWSFAPDVPFLIDAIPAERFVYYCVDDFTQFEGYDAEYIAADEQEMIKRADLVLVTSNALLQEKGRRRPDAVLMRHGVDYDHFASAWRAALRMPTDRAAIPRPAFGYHGVIHNWVDLELLAEVARLRPLYSFVLLGECKVDSTAIDGLDNIYRLGRKPYAALPAYAAGFDGALMLFKKNKMTPHVNPIKLHEYLAAGLRVVSSDIPEARRYEGAVLLANSATAYAAACDRVLRETDNWERETISRLVEEEDWTLKVERLSHIVLAGRNRTLSAAERDAASVLPAATRRQEAPVGG
jgi:hypothetical protein